jgi:hypothetical protein
MMVVQTLGRFGRLRQTLLDNEMNKDMQPLLSIANHSHNKSKKHPSEASESNIKIQLAFEWLNCCLTEEHIEPSQPKIGKICGWPLRPFLRESLYADFKCWCIQRGVSLHEMPTSCQFYFLTDRIFQLEGEKYLFPPVEECKIKYQQLINERRKNI